MVKQNTIIQFALFYTVIPTLSKVVRVTDNLLCFSAVVEDLVGYFGTPYYLRILTRTTEAGPDL